MTLWDVDAAGLEKARKELSRGGARVFAYPCDVTKGPRVAALARRAVKDMGRVDILVNNAGILVPGGFLDQPVEKWQKTVDVNLVALLHTIHAFLPDMHARNTGAIVNVSSAAGLLGVPGIAVYGATKWAVFGLTEALRHESWNAGKRGVKWASIHPMYVREGIFAGARLPGLGGLMFPRVRSHDEVAKAIVEYALKRGRFAPIRPRMVKITLVLRGLSRAAVDSSGPCGCSASTAAWIRGWARRGGRDERQAAGTAPGREAPGGAGHRQEACRP